MPKLPEILEVRQLSSRGMFRFEEFDLRFSNGVERTYQRIAPGARKAVMAVPVNERDEVLLIREYYGGVHEYLLTLPKGAVEPGEDPRDGMNRELKEEIGFGARHIEPLRDFTLAPGHMGFEITAMLATDLYPEALEGDEPEPLEVVRWPLAKLPELFELPDLSEARVIAALVLARQVLNNRTSG